MGKKIVEYDVIYHYSLKIMRINRYVIISVIVFVIISVGLISRLFVDRLSDGTEKVLPVPRFVSLGADEVNLRVGPGVRYPISLILKKQGLPVEIIKEFDVWRQVQTFEGDKGWVHKSLLSGRRDVIITGYTRTVYKRPKPISRAVVKLEPGVVAKLFTCKDEWCKIESSGYTGWINREYLWGVYPNEIFEK